MNKGMVKIGAIVLFSVFVWFQFKYTFLWLQIDQIDNYGYVRNLGVHRLLQTISLVEWILAIFELMLVLLGVAENEKHKDASNKSPTSNTASNNNQLTIRFFVRQHSSKDYTLTEKGIKAPLLLAQLNH